MSDTYKHHYNIDWIRALSSVAVVALHYGAIPPALLTDLTSPWALFNGFVLRLAVPLFMMVSVFLFAGKPRDRDYLIKKVKYLLFLALVWSMIYLVAKGGLLTYFKKITFVLKEVKNAPSSMVYFLLTDLETVFYFFISLPIVLATTFVLQNKSTRIVVIFLLTSIATIGMLPFVKDGFFVKFYNPLNFIAFAPIGILVNRHYDYLMSKRWAFGGLLLFATVILGVGEAYVSELNAVNLVDGYTKNSLIALTTAVLLLTFTGRKTNKVISFMSKHSLPLYLFHSCLYGLVGTICDLFFTKLIGIDASNQHVYAWAVAVVLCYLISKFIAPRLLSPAVYSG